MRVLYTNPVHSTVNYSAEEAVILAAANPTRDRLILCNDSSATLYVKFGAGAASNLFTFKMDPDDTWISPPGWSFIGDITGIWGAPLDPERTGAVMVTELL